MNPLIIEVDEFTYTKGDITIVFLKAPFRPGLFVFEVKDNFELEQKLLASVKNKQVAYSSIKPCVEALFNIVDKNQFEKLLNNEEIKALAQWFEETFDDLPKFKSEDLTTAADPLFFVTITNTVVSCIEDVHKTGQSRTVGNAKGQALKALRYHVVDLKKIII